MCDERRAQVYMDGDPVMVPWRACCPAAARGALGLARGVAVAREEAPGAPLALAAGHEFHEGERYVTAHLGDVLRSAGVEDDGGGPREL